jgi:hypothetical protein
MPAAPRVRTGAMTGLPGTGVSASFVTPCGHTGSMADMGLSLGAAAVKVACKIWLRDHAIAADASVEVADILKAKIADDRDRRKVKRQFDLLEEAVADRILEVLGHEFRGLDEGERSAAVWLVHDSLQRARLTEADLFDADLDPIYLEQQIRRSDRTATRDLTEVGTALYNRVLAECCTDIVELTTALPEYSQAAFAEILRRETKLIDMVRDLLDRVPAREIPTLRVTAEEEFAAAYRAQIVNRLDRLRLFGITQAPQRYPLSVAYVSLNVASRDILDNPQYEDAGQFGKGPHEPARNIRSTVRVERVLSQFTRILIRGEAGSGKTTLLQWLAVRSARYDFEEPLSKWNALVPFFIQLRNYADRQLPEPADFVRQIGRHLADKMPAGWVTELLDKGLAMVLIDGVDELPSDQRGAARRWLVELIEEFPAAHYVVTSRPAAIGEEWLDSDDFLAANLEPMSPADVTSFVRKWHEAVGSEVVDSAESVELSRCEHKMQTALIRGRRLRQLATNPLMCALLCALHRDRRTRLPNDRIEIYDAALEMLLERRDIERGVPGDIPRLSRRRKMYILQALAYWLVRNGWSNGPLDRAAEQVATCLTTMSDVDGEAPVVLQSLLERSGVVREPVTGRVDFIHRTFQDYLAARAIVDGGELGILLQHADNDLWQDVIVLAVGYAGSAVREELLTDLLHLARNAPDDKRARLHIVALACLEAAPQIPVDARAEIEKEATRLLPPATMAQAEAVAKSGEFGLELLMRQPIRKARQAAAAIRAASLVGGDEALRLIAACRHFSAAAVTDELMRAWPRFDPVVYARDILAGKTFQSVSISDPLTLPALRYMNARKLRLVFPDGYGAISDVQFPDNLQSLVMIDRLLTDITVLQACSTLESLTLTETGRLDVTPLRSCPALRHLDLSILFVTKPAALGLLDQLTSLEVSGLSSFEYVRHILPRQGRLSRFGMRQARDLTNRELHHMRAEPCLERLNFLLLGQCEALTSVTGIENWRDTLSGAYIQAPHLRNYQLLGELPRLEFLNIRTVPISDLSFIQGLKKLRVLYIGGTTPIPDLEPLLSLPRLETLFVHGSGIDLTPLRGSVDLQVVVQGYELPPGAELLGRGSRITLRRPRPSELPPGGPRSLEDVDRTGHDQRDGDDRDGRLEGHGQFRPPGQWHHVRRAERGGVGERQVQVVGEGRLPVRWRDVRGGHLRELEIGVLPYAEGAGDGPAAVELPVPQPEHDHVRQPDRAAGDQERAGVLAFCAPDEPAGQPDQRPRVSEADQRRQHQAQRTQRGGLPVDAVRVRHQERHEQDALERGQDPHRAEHRQPSGHDDLQRDRDGRADGGLPARLPVSAALPRGSPRAQVYSLRRVHAGIRHEVLDPV